MGVGLERPHGEGMARQFTRVTVVAAIWLPLVRLGRLLQDQPEGPPWQVVLISAAALGAVFTWAGVAYRLRNWTISAVNLAGMAFAVVTLSAPATLRYGVLPNSDTFAEVWRQLGFAYELIRYGAAPVLPVVGLIAILAVAFWILGAVASWGVGAGKPLPGAVAALVFYLQLATLDRNPAGFWWTVSFAVIAAAALVSVGAPTNGRTGRAFDALGRPIARHSRALPALTVVLMVAASLGATSALAKTVPETGAIDWRSHSGVGSGLYGGTSFNLFVGLQQELVSLSDKPLFVARLSEGAPSTSQIYWKLITLDAFDGQNWIPSAQQFSRQGQARWERPDWVFRGATVNVAAKIRIEGLREQFLPTVYSTTALRSDVDLISDGFRVREDGSVAIDVRSRPGWEYEISASIPQPQIARLASLGEGLSPIFQEASTAGVFGGKAVEPRFEPRPEGIDNFLELPEGLPLEIRQLAREVTGDGVTRFEQALILESWLRDPSIFTYSTDVTTGHGSLDLSEWLLDPNSPNFRTGYCEQFATAMGVMARALGIPSRVVLGFTPGDIQRQGDGSPIVVVRERNAHAWVELWFDGNGWIRFDPTPRADGVNPSLGINTIGFDPRAYVPAPDEPAEEAGNSLTGNRPRLEGTDIDISGGDPTPDLTGTGRGFSIPLWTRWMLGILALLGFVPASRQVRRRRRLGRINTGDVTAAWEEIIDRLRDLGEDVPDTATPMETADRFGVVPLATMYSAAVYGGVRRGDGRVAFADAESRILTHYQRATRLYGWMVPRSLFTDGRFSLQRRSAR